MGDPGQYVVVRREMGWSGRGNGADKVSLMPGEVCVTLSGKPPGTVIFGCEWGEISIPEE